MEEKENNVFGYIDELNKEELYKLQDVLVSEIENLKYQNDRKNLDFEIERLRYVKKELKEKEEKQKIL